VETLRSDRLYASPWLSVREDEVLRTDGSTGIYRVVESSDICLVIPTDGDRLHLVEQYRHPVGGRRWEFPSGSTEPPSDVDPEAVAARELREETGLVAARLTLLGTIEISPSTSGSALPGLSGHRSVARPASARTGGAGHAVDVVHPGRGRADDR
jgi:8-oxo-dGTP pyrophosphatase MutT (NUDIX family)